MTPPVLVFVVPGVLFFLIQMLLCRAYHFHVTMAVKKSGPVKSTRRANPKPRRACEDHLADDHSEHEGSCPGENSASVTELSSTPSADNWEDRLKTRRKSVFAESYDPASDKDYKQIVHPKTPEEKQWLLDNLADITLFQHLATDQIITVVDAMYKHPVKDGDVIMKQGDKGNIFYMIQSGVYKVLVTDLKGREKLMHTYHHKGSFGELALLYNQPRAATILAATDGVLWAVDGQTFRRIVHKITYEKRLMYESLINNVPLLKTLEPFECSNLVDALTPKTFRDNDEIIKQGEQADGMYFVISGTVRLVVKYDNGTDALLKVLSGGDYFGELGLLTNKPRAASAISVGVSHLAFLDREAFERLLGPCMAVMRRNICDYQQEMEELIRHSHM
ncbi:cAMP-dependent protein kinase type II regulatory subunit-like [Macrosteles quadrilineatus]|uniref:cAMP-dependent protein kinase type II regulatory subunit-like n=1 Tax=Macrosteles quadrilineatus TaxID=74068 RepID=UPI0023E1B15A|nr:cAMP-dependent protein kinase type II regulatory subunit-like [Macrosteles quadrilineatus]